MAGKNSEDEEIEKLEKEYSAQQERVDVLNDEISKKTIEYNRSEAFGLKKVIKDKEEIITSLKTEIQDILKGGAQKGPLPVDVGRGALLEAIRAGKELKKTTTQPRVSPIPNKGEKSATSGFVPADKMAEIRVQAEIRAQQLQGGKKVEVSEEEWDEPVPANVSKPGIQGSMPKKEILEGWKDRVEKQKEVINTLTFKLKELNTTLTQETLDADRKRIDSDENLIQALQKQLSALKEEAEIKKQGQEKVVDVAPSVESPVGEVPAAPPMDYVPDAPEVMGKEEPENVPPAPPAPEFPSRVQAGIPSASVKVQPLEKRTAAPASGFMEQIADVAKRKQIDSEIVDLLIKEMKDVLMKRKNNTPISFQSLPMLNVLKNKEEELEKLIDTRIRLEVEKMREKLKSAFGKTMDTRRQAIAGKVTQKPPTEEELNKLQVVNAVEDEIRKFFKSLDVAKKEELYKLTGGQAKIEKLPERAEAGIEPEARVQAVADREQKAREETERRIQAEAEVKRQADLREAEKARQAQEIEKRREAEAEEAKIKAAAEQAEKDKAKETVQQTPQKEEPEKSRDRKTSSELAAKQAAEAAQAQGASLGKTGRPTITHAANTQGVVAIPVETPRVEKPLLTEKEKDALKALQGNLESYIKNRSSAWNKVRQFLGGVDRDEKVKLAKGIVESVNRWITTPESKKNIEEYLATALKKDKELNDKGILKRKGELSTHLLEALDKINHDFALQKDPYHKP